MKQYLNTDYDIDENGRCYSHKSNKFLTPQMTTKYPTYNLTYPDGKKKKTKVHRMVAETYIPNPENKPFVNHKDGNTHNFNVNNLEWVTPQENSQHAVHIGLKPKGNQNAIYYTSVLENEKWVQAIWFKNYLVSSCGRAMNKNTKRLLKLHKNPRGYLEANLWENGKGTTTQIHRLVYYSFNPMTDKSLVINHLNGIKTDNMLENLEACTYQENNLHAEYVIQTHQSGKKVGQFKRPEDIKPINVFSSVAQAAATLNINNIARAAKTGTRAGKYYWKYLE